MFRVSRFSVQRLALLAAALCFSFIPLIAETLWLEAEEYESSNFIPGVTVAINAAGNGVSSDMMVAALTLDDPGENPYYVQYSFTADGGEYDLWIAGAPQTVYWISPLRLIVNDAAPVALTGIRSQGKSFGSSTYGFFGWLPVGKVALAKGENTIRIEVVAPRNSDNRYVAFLDAIVLTQDASFNPQDNYPQGAPKPPFSEARNGVSLAEYLKVMEYPLYERRMGHTNEQLGEASSAEVIRKLMARPLPSGESADSGPNEFGVHGMEFIRSSEDPDKVNFIYELLARAGVQSIRTAESCWHRLGAGYNNFKELDFQIENAQRYGMTHLFTVGYPPEQFNVHPHYLSAVQERYIPMYEDYLATLIKRYRDKGVRYIELGNEVDAPDTWWRGEATAEMYVNEMRLLREAVDKYAPQMQVVAFGATYSRNPHRGGENGGQRFIAKCFDLGIDQYVDVYALHYTWPISEKGFPEFIHAQMDRVGVERKPLINTEEAGYVKPSDVIKLFARNFFLHDMPRVDYYLSRDWFEAGNLISSGLFDMNWNPKLRLLPYALSVDAMKNHELVGMAEPTEGVEAYVLRNMNPETGVSAYSVVMWKNDPLMPEKIGTTGPAAATPQIEAVTVSGIVDPVAAYAWNLDPLPVDKGTIAVNDEPVVVFCDQLPQWTLLPAAQWLSLQFREADSEAMLPSNL